MPVVIVAIPEVQDRVHKLSSEKVPHLTMMYLGEDVPAEKLHRIVLFVEHAASQIQRFSLTVDRRGELGDDKADVLFFEKNGYVKELKDILANFLSNRDIYEAYNSTTQFPEWIPHLTLGFPATPARTLEDASIYHVSFDRIAVWTGDYDGPEFRLKGWDDMAEVGWSDEQRDSGASALSRVLTGMVEVDPDKDATQFGIKGMKWGVRRSEAQLARARAEADPDAIKAVETQAKIQAAGSLNVVSSKDLQQLVDRMKLEEKYIKATLESSAQTQKGKSLISKAAGLIGREFTMKAQGKDGPLLMGYKFLKGRRDARSKALLDAAEKARAARAEKDRLRKVQKERERQANGPKHPGPFATATTGNPAARRTANAQRVYNVTTLQSQGNPLALPRGRS